MDEQKLNQDLFKPLTAEQIELLKDFVFKDANFFGRDKLYYSFTHKYPNEKVSRRAIWNWMDKQEVFQQNRRPVMKRGIVRPMVSKKKGWIQMDNIDMTSNAYNGFNYICHAVDLFTKKDYAKAINALTVQNMKKCVDEFIADGMEVSYLQSDRGSEFQGDFGAHLQDKSIIHKMSKAHSPWSNGTVESRNSAIKRNIFMWMRTSHDTDWPSKLPQIMENINNTFSYATKASANDIDKNTELHEAIGKHLENVASKRYKGKSSSSKDLQVGDWVRRRITYDPSNVTRKSKTGYWTDEIYEVTKVLKAVKTPNVTASYKIRDVKTKNEVSGLHSFGSLMKIPKDTVFHEKPPVRPEAVNGAEVSDPAEREWEVESILDVRMKRATRTGLPSVMYKVKWVGWKKPTWEDERNMTHAEDAIAKFMRTRQK